MSQNDCIQSRHVNEPCEVCRRSVKVVHLPNRPIGFFCEYHCPVCAEVHRPRVHSHIANTHVQQTMEPALAGR